MRPSGRFSHRTLLTLTLGAGACALSVPPLRSLIEQSMVWHMVVQMPMLLAAGWLFAGRPVVARDGPLPRTWDHFGLTSFMLAQAIFSYWMLPSAIDRAVVLPLVDLLKLLSLFCAGVLLQRAMARSPSALQLFVVGYAVSMLFAAGSFVASADQRLCNAYSLESQWKAGLGLVALGATIGAVWLWGAVRKSFAANITRIPT